MTSMNISISGGKATVYRIQKYFANYIDQLTYGRVVDLTLGFQFRFSNGYIIGCRHLDKPGGTTQGNLVLA